MLEPIQEDTWTRVLFSEAARHRSSFQRPQSPPYGAASARVNPPRKVSGSCQCNKEGMRAGHRERRAGGHAPGVDGAAGSGGSDAASKLTITPHRPPTAPPANEPVSMQDARS